MSPYRYFGMDHHGLNVAWHTCTGGCNFSWEVIFLCVSETNIFSTFPVLREHTFSVFLYNPDTKKLPSLADWTELCRKYNNGKRRYNTHVHTISYASNQPPLVISLSEQPRNVLVNVIGSQNDILWQSVNRQVDVIGSWKSIQRDVFQAGPDGS